jgi:predicted Zn-dependent protease
MSVIWFAAVLLCILANVGCSGSERYYIERGNTLMQTGKAPDAVIQYRKAIQKNSQSGEAHYRLGLAQLRAGEAIEALNTLNRAVQLLPGNQDAAARLADLYLAAYLSDRRHAKGFYNRVVALSDGLVQKDPNSMEGLRLKGALALVDQKPQEAVAYYQKANQLYPLQRPVVEGLVQALFLSNRAEDGERAARDFLEKDKTAGSIYDILYLRFLTEKRTAEAEKILLAKVANNPREANYRLQLAQFYAQAKQPAQMETALQYLLDHPQEFPRARLQVGDFYSGIGDRDQAMRQFQLGAGAGGKEKVIYQKRIVAVLASKGKREEALKMADQILADETQDTEAATVVATLLIDGGSSGEIARAIAELKRLANQNHGDTVVHFQLGRAYLLSGSQVEARAEFLESARLRSDFDPPRLALAEMGMSTRKPQDALTMSEQILARDPNQPRARLLHAAALAGLGHLEESRTELKRLLSDFPQSAEVQTELGLVAISEKNYLAAEQIFGKLQERGADDPLAAAGLAETYSAQKQFDKAIQVLQGEFKKSPRSPIIGKLLAFTAMRARNYGIAIEAYETMLETSPKEPGLYYSLAQAYFAKQDYEHAVQALKQAQLLAPQDGRIDMMLAAALNQLGRNGDARPYLEWVLQSQPNNPVALNNMAFYLAENGGNLDEAQRLAQRAVQKAPAEANFSDTLGWIYVKKNMHGAAAQIFRNLVEKQPNNSTLHYHLAVALMGQGDSGGAAYELRAALSRSPAKEEEQRIRTLLATLN